MDSRSILRLGTRGSLLARMQSRQVADRLMAMHAGLHIELIVLKTTGDRVTDRPLHDIGGKGLFVKELELALLAGEVDFAVHSMKDVPVTMPLVDASELVIAAVPARADARDVAAFARPGMSWPPPPGSRVGTGSLRRQSQVLASAANVTVLPLRGNIDTRLRKCREGEYEVVLLAMAGLRRAGLFDASNMSPLPLDQMLPAAGQGALALQCRRGDTSTRAMLAALNDADTRQCVDLERAVVAGLRGDCHSPIAALATVADEKVSLYARVASRDGGLPLIQAKGSASVGQADHALAAVLASLHAQGADELLHGTADPDNR